MPKNILILVFILLLAALAYAFADAQNLGGVFCTATPTPTRTLAPYWTRTPKPASEDGGGSGDNCIPWHPGCPAPPQNTTPTPHG